MQRHSPNLHTPTPDPRPPAPSTLLLVGCGKMGSALLARWAASRAGGVNHIAVVEPHALQESLPDVRFFPAVENIPEGFKPGAVVFAIKPQQMDDALPDYVARFGVKPLYLSIAAGKSLDYFAQQLGNDAAIVRAMPNTPAMIGEGMTALVANAHVTLEQKTLATALMEAVGKTVWVKENAMDAITAISGSGPAYVFLFMEALHKAAVKAGLSDDVATDLVRQTVKGSALLAEQDDFATLRKNVTSPGGTTEAALNVLQKGGFEKLLAEAVSAAVKRSKEL